MEPETEASQPGVLLPRDAREAAPLQDLPPETPAGREPHDLSWAFVGQKGIRVGWLAITFFCLFRGFDFVLGTIAVTIDPALARTGFSPFIALISELIPFIAMLGAGAIMIAIERRHPLEYNLGGPRPVLRFLGGMVVGFAMLSVLVACLAWGGWLHFGPVALSGSRIFMYAAVWGVVFLMVGGLEEGIFRCYVQYTLTRGINFWWALATVGGLCLYELLFNHNQSTWGVDAIAALGLVPCLLLHLNKTAGASFWQAAWAGSTGFGFVHTFNNGETWLGIFCAAFIGFVFCVSIRVTGSAWWAIGCHSAWDWAETYFYGTADSGMVAKGHYLTTFATGNPLWSGGADGPEGSLLVLPVIVLMLVLLLLIYRRRKVQLYPVPPTGTLEGSQLF